VVKPSLPHKGFKKGTLAIPSRLARNSSQGNFGEWADLAHNQEKKILLDGRGQVQKRHILADPRWRNMAQPGQLPVVRCLARSNQLVQLMGQRHNSRYPMWALLWVAHRHGRECGRRNTPAGRQREFNLQGCCPFELSLTVTAPVLPS
jgi:hypothetical protein